MGWFEDVDAGSGLSGAEQTYANQTAAREAYYNQNPEQAPTFSANQQAGLDDLINRGGPVETQRGPGGPQQTPDLQTAWAQAIAGLTANERDQGSLQAVADRLNGMGFQVTLPPTDEMGRNQGLIINGKLHRVIDSSNQWTLQEGSGAWGDGGDGGAEGEQFARNPDFAEEFSHPAWNRTFTPPDGASLQEDPGFQMRLREGQKALERSAAAKGTLLTGGTLKGIMQYGQEMGSQEYGSMWNRERQKYESDYNDYLGDYGRKLGEYGQRHGIFGENYQRGLQGWQQAKGDQNQEFGQLFSLAGMDSDNDFRYANLYGNTLMNGTGQSNELMLGGANANAAGRVGSGNAYSNAFSNAANPFWNALFYKNLTTPAEKPRPY